ncbi:MAG: bifunctional phosphopantothenoylcysteine decarboxylase/phosphopantothenate--cysteine ligase CoaBC [Candidatus Dormibacteraeota bacterium]|nr:bifunctional phosphopantothenoylcysteine decarboxylase/phosphopantothenate--cysteine ligase CoaBC [Candidatus Dormibacteraeota bacterium]
MPFDPAEVPAEVRGKRVVLLVAGGIAAYKVADLTSQLSQSGCEVRVGMTSSAMRFVGPATFHGLSGHPVETSLWDPDSSAEPHVALGDWGQVILVAPATANLLSRLAAGSSADLVSATILAARCPVVVAPAMNDAMWSKAAVAANVAALRERGLWVVEPASGRLASGHSGAGRLAAPREIFAALAEAIRAGHDLAGRRVVVTAGGTREAIDPVRFISNYSSGKMGNALAQAAAERGAEVILVTTAPFTAQAGVSVRPVESAAEMLAAVKAEMKGTDLLLMVAAVADFRPAIRETGKIRREDRDSLRLDLEKNVDILAELARDGDAAGTFRLGFAAEDADLERHAMEKLKRKQLDAIVANDISGGVFGSDENAGVMFLRSGERIDLARSSKRVMADRILDAVRDRLR